jgi:hypothetical protein
VDGQRQGKKAPERRKGPESTRFTPPPWRRGDFFDSVDVDGVRVMIVHIESDMGGVVATGNGRMGVDEEQRVRDIPEGRVTDDVQADDNMATPRP